MTEVTPASRPNAEARRQQIVDAASACVRRAGFHGASMAEIAHAAGLSVGQIYRYFANKEAIIADIVARDMAAMRDKFSELQNSGEPLLEAIINSCSQAVDDYYDPERSALMLEVVAERVQFLSGGTRRDGTAGGEGFDGPPSSDGPPPATDDDIPF